MKFTIGTVSSSMEFEEDMRLIKSSLLYADEIELMGMLEYAVFNYLPRAVYGAKDLSTMLHFLDPFMKYIDFPEKDKLNHDIKIATEQLKQVEPLMRKKRGRNKQELIAQMRLNKTVEESRGVLIQALEGSLNSDAYYAIKDLIEKKYITVFDYKYDNFDLEELAGSYFGTLLKTMRSGNAYALFDETSTEIIKNVVETRILDIGRLDKESMRHAGVATNVLMTLPTLEKASIDEIISFKKELQAPLVNFRKAIYIFSEEIESLPWDENFQVECLKIYGKEVAPRVEELNELASDTSVLKNLGTKVIRDEEIRKEAGYLVGGIASTVVSQADFWGAMEAIKDIFMGVALITVAPQVAKGFLKSMSLVSKAREETKAVEKEMKSNMMYYYYKASRDLGKK